MYNISRYINPMDEVILALLTCKKIIDLPLIDLPEILGQIRLSMSKLWTQIRLLTLVQIGKNFHRKVVNIFLSVSLNICFGYSK